MNPASVDALHRAGTISDLDLAFAGTIGRLAGETRPEVLLAAALASRHTQRGHVCLELPRLTTEPVRDGDGARIEDLCWPEPGPWLAALGASPLVAPPGGGPAPLVLDDRGRLYLTRYWRLERRLADLLLARASAPIRPGTIDAALLADGLARLFPRTDHGDPQAAAARTAVERRLAVISGGPGTGKTSTVVKILALLLEQAERAGRPRLHTTLVAPTGKAAARLAESIRSAKAALPASEAIRARIPEQASTIHRCLQPIPGSATRFRHGADRPLAADVVIVDEASMVDLALMTRLLEAVPPEARLIMLGDKDQLASIEVGAILGDICAAPAGSSSALAPAVVGLSRSYRYSETSGIGALARAINAGDAPQALLHLAPGKHTDVELRPLPPEGGLGDALTREIIAGYRPFLEAGPSRARAEAFGRFRVLCAHRRGPHGVEAVNRHAEHALAAAGLLDLSGRFYERRPIMITENDYGVRLWNGDIGLITTTNGGSAAVFTAADGTERALAPSRLPPHETVYAMTVHKSQGSELDEVVVVVPEHASLVLSRELLYTAITRARRRVTIYGTADLITRAISHPIQRASGLREALWGPDPT